MLKSLLRALRHRISVALPNRYVFNYLLAATKFMTGNRRLPRSPRNPRATINDFIFDRMIRNRISAVERLCVDKEFAKPLARQLCDHVDIAETIAVCSIDPDTPVSDISAWIKTFVGRRLVAKPTHGSGRVLFLDRPPTDLDIAAFVAGARESYFPYRRETQYDNLARKIIVEQNISPAAESPTDYKFFCSRGQVLCCQVDVDRFTGHKRAICSLPDFSILPVRYGYDAPANVEKPPNLDAMIDVARRLSTPFEFVRIDLYREGDRIYFGEFTLSPTAGADHISDERFGVQLLREVRTSLAA
jgi:hypothetical protein